MGELQKIFHNSQHSVLCEGSPFIKDFRIIPRSVYKVIPQKEKQNMQCLKEKYLFCQL